METVDDLALVFVEPDGRRRGEESVLDFLARRHDESDTGCVPQCSERSHSPWCRRFDPTPLSDAEVQVWEDARARLRSEA